MRELIYHVATSVDGFIAKLDHTFDCFPSEGGHVTDYFTALKAYDTVVMGRRTYEVGLNRGVSDPYPWMDTWVFSRTLEAPASSRVHVVRDNAAASVRALKERAGAPIYLCGGGVFAASLFEAGLVDAVHLKLCPLVLGAGVALAPGLAEHRALTLRDSKRYESGVVLLRYDVGAPT